MERTTLYGACCLCGKRTSKAGMTRHLASCAPAHDAARGPSERLLQLRVEGHHDTSYWIDLELAERSTLEELDQFLRSIWLECCGHLSAFRIGHFQHDEDDLDVSLSDALGPTETRFSYEYDFGSTTRLQLRVTRRREGSVDPRSSIRLLARNEAPSWPCSVCERPATLVCTSCLDGEGSLCDDGKPKVLFMKYTGADCSGTTHTQDPSKVECFEFLGLGTGSVFIVAGDKANVDDARAKIWFSGEVPLGATFPIDSMFGAEVDESKHVDFFPGLSNFALFALHVFEIPTKRISG